MSKPKKLKKLPPHRVFVLGSAQWSKPNKIKAALKGLCNEDNQLGQARGVDMLYTGTQKGAELQSVSIAKELKFPVTQAHPFTHMGPRTDRYMRNFYVLKDCKITHLLIFDDDAEEDVSLKKAIREAKHRDIPFTVVPSKSIEKVRK